MLLWQHVEGRGNNWERQSERRAGRAGLSKVPNKASAFYIIFLACIYYLFGNVFSPKLFLWLWRGGRAGWRGPGPPCIHPAQPASPARGPGVTGPRGWTTALIKAAQPARPCSVSEQGMLRGWQAHKARLPQSPGPTMTPLSFLLCPGPRWVFR